MKLSFRIDGKPVAKARARVGSRGSFTPKNVATYENWVRVTTLEAMNKATTNEDGSPFSIECPVTLTLRFYRPRPKKPKKEYEEAPGGRPDLKNLIASVEDGMNLAGIWRDDSLVCWYGEGTGKYWATEDHPPGVEVEVEW